MERHVARIRLRVQERLWSSLVRGVSPEARQKLALLLAVPETVQRGELRPLRNPSDSVEDVA
jgi:hypothetical protein